MGRTLGMGILRMIALVGFAAIVILFVLTAGSAFMPGTKIGPMFGATPEALAGQNEGMGGKTKSLKAFATGEFGEPPDAGTAPDAGTLAAQPAEQGSAAPADAHALPEQQGR